MGVGLIVSLMSSQNIKKLDPALVAPFLRNYVRSNGQSLSKEIKVCIYLYYFFKGHFYKVYALESYDSFVSGH